MMKKLLSLLIVLSVTLLTLAGCGSSATQKPADTTQAGQTQAQTQAPAKKYKIATVVKLTGIGWFLYRPLPQGADYHVDPALHHPLVCRNFRFLLYRFLVSHADLLWL
jgi:uncharacterized protein YceK